MKCYCFLSLSFCCLVSVAPLVDAKDRDVCFDGDENGALRLFKSLIDYRSSLRQCTAEHVEAESMKNIDLQYFDIDEKDSMFRNEIANVKNTFATRVGDITPQGFRFVERAGSEGDEQSTKMEALPGYFSVSFDK